MQIEQVPLRIGSQLLAKCLDDGFLGSRYSTLVSVEFGIATAT